METVAESLVSPVASAALKDPLELRSTQKLGPSACPAKVGAVEGAVDLDQVEAKDLELGLMVAAVAGAAAGLADCWECQVADHGSVQPDFCSTAGYEQGCDTP